MNYLGFTDILRRWVYSRRGLQKMMARGDFPAPVFALNEGRNKAWHLTDITAFEQSHPEVTSLYLKHRKVVSYAIGASRKRNRGEA